MRTKNEMMPPADAGPVERPVRPVAEALHAAVCQAVALLNRAPEVARCAEGREARDLLRQALADYADAYMDEPTHAGVFGGTPKTDPDYAHSEAALRAELVDRLRKGPAPLNDPDLNDQAADCLARISDPRRTIQAAYQKALDEAIAFDKQCLVREDPLMERINRSGTFADAP